MNINDEILKDAEYLIDFNIPKDYDKKGNWILIRNEVPVQIPIRPLSIYFGIPVPKQCNDYGRTSFEWMYQIQTDWSQVNIRKHEYSIITPERMKEYLAYLSSGDLIPKFYNTTVQFSQKLKDSIFYMRSRGLNYEDALVYSLGAIDKPDVLRLEMHENYLREFFGDEKVDKLLEYEKNFVYVPEDSAIAEARTEIKTKNANRREKYNFDKKRKEIIKSAGNLLKYKLEQIEKSEKTNENI